MGIIADSSDSNILSFDFYLEFAESAPVPTIDYSCSSALTRLAGIKRKK
jgi:hypothetical protein